MTLKEKQREVERCCARIRRLVSWAGQMEHINRALKYTFHVVRLTVELHALAAQKIKPE